MTQHLRSALPLLALAACGDLSIRSTPAVDGSGTAAADTREVSGFRAVSFAIPGELTIVRGDAEGVRIEADDNLLPLIETRVRDGVLEIRSGAGRLEPRSPLRVWVTARALEAVTAAGSGSVEAHGLRGGELALTVAGSGSVRAHDLQADLLRSEVAGSGSVEVAGRAPRQVITIAGSGGLDALGLESDVVDARIAGSGSARVHARERISARIAGSGSVLYRGDPEVSATRAGSGSVRRLEP